MKEKKSKRLIPASQRAFRRSCSLAGPPRRRTTNPPSDAADLKTFPDPTKGKGKWNISLEDTKHDKEHEWNVWEFVWISYTIRDVFAVITADFIPGLVNVLLEGVPRVGLFLLRLILRSHLVLALDEGLNHVLRILTVLRLDPQFNLLGLLLGLLLLVQTLRLLVRLHFVELNQAKNHQDYTRNNCDPSVKILNHKKKIQP